jgi:hypothetical protein
MEDEYPSPPELYIEICSAGEVTEACVFPNQESEKTCKGSIKIVDGAAHPEFRILRTYNGPLNGVVINFEYCENLVSSPEGVLPELEKRRKRCPECYAPKTISQIRRILSSVNRN